MVRLVWRARSVFMLTLVAGVRSSIHVIPPHMVLPRVQTLDMHLNFFVFFGETNHSHKNKAVLAVQYNCQLRLQQMLDISIYKLNPFVLPI